MKHTGLYAVAATASLVASPAAAQSYRDFHQDRSSEVRVSAGVTIPFGGKKRSAQTKPRVDLAIDQRIQRQEVFVPVNSVRANEMPDWRRTSLSLTFEDNPRMMLNGMQVARFNLTASADEEGEGGGVSPWLIGGAVVLGGLTWITLEAADEIGDAFVED